MTNTDLSYVVAVLERLLDTADMMLNLCKMMTALLTAVVIFSLWEYQKNKRSRM